MCSVWAAAWRVVEDSSPSLVQSFKFQSTSSEWFPLCAAAREEGRSKGNKYCMPSCHDAAGAGAAAGTACWAQGLGGRVGGPSESCDPVSGPPVSIWARACHITSATACQGRGGSDRPLDHLAGYHDRPCRPTLRRPGRLSSAGHGLAHRLNE